MTVRRAFARFEHRLAARIKASDVSEIATGLPESSIEQHLASLPVLHPSGAVRRIQLPVSDVLEGCGGTPWWVMLSGIGRDCPVAADSWAQAVPWVGRTAAGERGLGVTKSTLFASSPGAVVPAHIDVEHNVLLQIEGAKEVTLVPPGSAEDEIERCMSDTGRNLLELPSDAQTIRLGPGDGLYLPPFTPHWVLGLDGTSIAFSCAWSTGCSEDERLVRYWNAKQRRLGLQPRTPDATRLADRAKAAAVRLRSRLRARQ
ncbi:MAG: cupin-like domain-containing protein [Acidimicrobiales bacterium]